MNWMTKADAAALCSTCAKYGHIDRHYGDPHMYQHGPASAPCRGRSVPREQMPEPVTVDRRTLLLRCPDCWALFLPIDYLRHLKKNRGETSGPAVV